MALSPPEEAEYLALLEAERLAHARDRLDAFCRYIDIPGAPVSGDDDCDRFYPDTVTPAAHHRLINAVLERVERREIPRAMFFMPPGSAKSTYASVVFPPWFMGRNPAQNIICTSYGTTLARKFGRKCRQITTSPRFQRLFGTTLKADNRSVEDWGLTNDSQYMAGGILSGITGNRADGLIIDDPIKGHEQADSPTIRDKTWDAYLTDLRTRLKPRGFIVIIQCMTGDTPVRMADGTERRLDSIKPGDKIATYRNGKMSASTVEAMRSNGDDSVYKITTSSGIVVRANARHPFLVSHSGEYRWIRTRDLTTAHKIVTAKGSGESGEESSAPPRDVTSQPSAAAYAPRTTTKRSGPTATGRPAAEAALDSVPKSNTATALPPTTTTRSWRSKAASALSVAWTRTATAATRLIGKRRCASTTATTPGACVASSATTAISQQDTLALSEWHTPSLTTSDFTLDPIASIETAGTAEVFDLQVAETENFIANGLVSHNTRWHEDDLAGRILPENYDGQSGWVTARDGERWYVLCLQAQAERTDDPLGRRPGEWLWTEWFSPAHWQAERRIQGERNWAALYQQRPKPAEGALIKRAWMQRYRTLPAAFLRIVQSWDTAYKDSQLNDPSACTTWGETRQGWYLLHVFKDRLEYPALKRAVASLAGQWRPHAILIEDKSSGQSLIQEMRGRGAAPNFAQPVIALEPEGSKLDRLVAVSPLFESGLVHLPEHAPWLMDFESELFGYPLTSHDDQVDSTSQALRWMFANRGHYQHLASGQTRVGLAQDTPADTRDAGYGSVRGGNNFRGFF